MKYTYIYNDIPILQLEHTNIEWGNTLIGSLVRIDDLTYRVANVSGTDIILMDDIH